MDTPGYSLDDLLTEDLDRVGRPAMPTLPKFDMLRIQEFSKEVLLAIQNYIGEVNAGDDASTQLINSIKTLIALRIQMSNVLNDLNLGISLATAIDRLQPLTDIIHETVCLPVDDDLDGGEVEADDETEPVGVAEIAIGELPFVNDFVRPQTPPRTPRARAKNKFLLLVALDNDLGMLTSDWDDVEGLTPDQVHELTDLLKEDYALENVLRARIQHITKMELTQRAKNKLVTRLMMGNYSKYQVLPAINSTPVQKPEEDILKSEEEDDDDDENNTLLEEVEVSQEDYDPLYHSPGVYGCTHYMLNCKLECPDCHRWYVCRFCHDAEVEDHKLARNKVKHVLCMWCGTPQEPETNECVECDQELARYFCRKCVLYDNDPSKDIYHCDKCGICRLGLGLDKDYFHCDTCNICLSVELREKHKCVSNTTHSNCPICLEYLFTLVKKVVFMLCGHLIHQHCYDDMIKHSYKCPICKKTVLNCDTQFRILDQEIAQQPMPPPYNQWRCIISCNDCKGKSNVAYHVLGLKCTYCKSFNTNQLRLIKPEDEDEAEEEVEGSTGFDEGVIRLVRRNIGTNFRMGDGFEEDEGYQEDNEGEEEGEADDSRFGTLRTMFQKFINNATQVVDDDDAMVGGL